MNIEALKEQFDHDGYIVLENFFDAELMDHLDRMIRNYYGDNPAFQHNDEFLSKSQTDVIPWFPQQQGVHDFDAIENNKDLQVLSDAILGDGWYRQYCMVMFSLQGSMGQAWHQDCPPDSRERFNLNRLVYTSDINDKIGGQTVVVPGSQKMGLLPAGDPTEKFNEQAVLRPKKGTLVLLHGHTWHRVLPITGGFRSSTNYRAAPAGTPEDITDICVYRNMRYRFSTSSVIEERTA